MLRQTTRIKPRRLLFKKKSHNYIHVQQIIVLIININKTTTEHRHLSELIKLCVDQPR